MYNGHLGNSKVSGMYRVTVIHIYRSTFQKIMATENFGKLSGDRNIQGDRYIMTGLLYKGLDCIISYT